MKAQNLERLKQIIGMTKPAQVQQGQQSAATGDTLAAQPGVVPNGVANGKQMLQQLMGQAGLDGQGMGKRAMVRQLGSHFGVENNGRTRNILDGIINRPGPESSGPLIPAASGQAPGPVGNANVPPSDVAGGPAVSGPATLPAAIPPQGQQGQAVAGGPAPTPVAQAPAPMPVPSLIGQPPPMPGQAKPPAKKGKPLGPNFSMGGGRLA